MKVLFIHHNTEMHGSSISLFTLIEGLQGKGVECAVVVPIDGVSDEAFLQRASRLSLTLYPVPLVLSVDADGWSKRYRCYKSLVKNIRRFIQNRKSSYREICSVVEKFRPDIVHTNVGAIHDGFWAARKFGIPHVFHIREYQDKGFHWDILPTKKLFEQILTKSSAVCTITDDIRYYFHQGNNPKAVTIYNGIYRSAEVVQMGEKENYFLFASRVSPEKGIEDIITAFSVFHRSHKDWRLLVAGLTDAAYLPTLQEIVAKTGCAESIRLLGYRSDVKQLMQRAKALVVGSYHEGFGRMTAEAAFNHCLVIGRNTSGTKEIMDKTGGFAFNDNDELLQRMFEVEALSPEVYTTSASRAREVAKAFFSIEQNVEKTLSVYNNICRNHVK